MTNKKLGVAKL